MIRAAVGVLTLFLCLPAVSAAQDVKSGDLVRQLGLLLDAKKLDTVATADGQNPGTFIAAMYFPGTQLLLVSAQYTAPGLLTELLARKDFRGVYVELSSASVQSSKMFVRDAYANGLMLKPAGDQPADSVESAGKEAVFNGAWKKAKITEADYLKSYTDADAAYTRALQLLIMQLKASGA
ncbi:MAG: hypothetical protein ABIQ52_00135 [Vicinamibacterales bacterium]